MTTSPTLSAERPPSDPVALRDWIAAREEAFARLTRTTLRRIVGRAGDAFTRSLDAGAGDLAAFDGIPMQWAEAVQSELMPELLDLYRAGALAALITAGGESLLAVGISSAGPTALADWDSIVNYDALAYQATATNRLVGVGDTIWSDVRQRTVTGLEAGWTNERMKDEIEGLGQFSEYRADTIARTEANAAYNGGNYDAADALGEYGPVAKTWSAFIDRRTRPSHAQANEQTVAFAEPFIVGGTPMDRPHDPLAPAEEVVNCRCRVLFLFDGDTDSTGRVWTRQRPQAAANVQPVAERVPDAPEPAPQRLTAEEQRAARRRRLDAENRALNKQTVGTATEAAEKVGVSVDEVIAARVQVAPTKAAIREAADRGIADRLAELERRLDGAFLTETDDAAWDFMERLTPQDRTRYRRWLNRARPGQEAWSPVDDALQRGMAREAWGFDVQADEAAEWHYRITQEIDALTALRAGRVPSARLYGDLDIDRLLEAELEHIKPSRVIGQHPDDAAAYLASVDRDLMMEDAYRALGDTFDTDLGPRPWRMSYQSWEEEVNDLWYGLKWYPSEMPPGSAERLAELIPWRFNVDASLEDIYTAIVTTAHTAGLEVPSYAVIPWA